MVTPVEVVDREQQRTVAAQVDGQPVEPVQHRERHVAAVRSITGTDRLEERPCGRGGAAEQRVVVLRRRHHRLEELAHDAERELALELSATRGQHEKARLLRSPARLRHQPRLPDSGWSLDEHEPPLAGGRLLDQFVERRQLALSLEQRAARHRSRS